MSIIDQLFEGMKHSGDVKFSVKRLAELQRKDLPRATCESVKLKISPKEGVDPSVAEDAIKAATDYLQDFAGVQGCPNCDRLYGFQWGIAYGEGACKCGYPARAIHDIEGIGVISGVVLYYHPSALKPRQPEQK